MCVYIMCVLYNTCTVYAYAYNQDSIASSRHLFDLSCHTDFSLVFQLACDTHRSAPHAVIRVTWHCCHVSLSFNNS